MKKSTSCVLALISMTLSLQVFATPPDTIYSGGTVYKRQTVRGYTTSGKPVDLSLGYRAVAGYGRGGSTALSTPRQSRFGSFMEFLISPLTRPAKTGAKASAEVSSRALSDSKTGRGSQVALSSSKGSANKDKDSQSAH